MPSESGQHDPELDEARPADDDYDLLTYGEAAARLAELINAERRLLGDMRSAPDPDTVAIKALEIRIELLVASSARYKSQSLSGEKFTERFGVIPRTRNHLDDR
jgi:hypothetical protein